MKIELKMVKLPLQNISVILFVAGIFFNILNVQAQKVYAVDAAYKADVKVFVVSSAYQADLLVYKVSSNYQAGDNDGKWFFYRFRLSSRQEHIFCRLRLSSRSQNIFCLFSLSGGLEKGF